MQTIVLIVIAVVALVVIVFYFYNGFNQGKSGTGTLLNISSNKTGESRCLSAQFGGCPSDKPYCCNGECIVSCNSCSGKNFICNNVCVANCDNCGGDSDNDGVCGG